MALILSREDLRKLDPPMKGAVAVIEKCCRIQASGDVTNHPRVHLAYPPSGESAQRAGFGNKTLRVLPAIVPGFDAAGFRTYAMGPRKRNETHALLVLFSFEDMTLLAIIDDTWLHYIRTGAPAGVAAKYLAKEKIETVGVLGSGRIARRAVEAVACVRDFRRLKIYSPTAEHRADYVKAMSELLKIEVEPQEDAHSVVRGSEILITATAAYKPVYDGSWLEPGTLVITTAPGEIDAATVERSTIFATSKDQAFHDQPPREPQDLCRGGKTRGHRSAQPRTARRRNGKSQRTAKRSGDYHLPRAGIVALGSRLRPLGLRSGAGKRFGNGSEVLKSASICRSTLVRRALPHITPEPN